MLEDLRMKQLTDKIAILPMILIALSGQVLAGSTTPAVTQARIQADLTEQATYSPRQYCRTTGGVVSETPTNHIYLCCYKAMSKCVVTDTKKSVSWLIQYQQRNNYVFIDRF